MKQRATVDQQGGAVAIVPAQQRRDMVIFGDCRVGLPQQIAHAATRFHSQFGMALAIMCLRNSDATPSNAGQLADVPGQVLPSIRRAISGSTARYRQQLLSSHPQRPVRPHGPAGLPSRDGRRVDVVMF